MVLETEPPSAPGRIDKLGGKREDWSNTLKVFCGEGVKTD